MEKENGNYRDYRYYIGAQKLENFMNSHPTTICDVGTPCPRWIEKRERSINYTRNLRKHWIQIASGVYPRRRAISVIRK